MTQPDVRVGQAWADNDKCSAGRTVRVDVATSTGYRLLGGAS